MPISRNSFGHSFSLNAQVSFLKRRFRTAVSAAEFLRGEMGVRKACFGYLEAGGGSVILGLRDLTFAESKALFGDLGIAFSGNNRIFANYF